MAGRTESDRIREQMANPIQGSPPATFDGRSIDSIANREDPEFAAANRAELEQIEAAEAEGPPGPVPPKYRELRTEAEAQKLKDLMVSEYDIMPIADRNRRMDTLRKWRDANPASAATDPFSPVNTTPVPTGLEAIDKAGETVTDIVGPHDRTITREIPALESMEFDDPTRIRADWAAEGVDYRHGLPFYQRAKIAFSPSQSDMRGERIKEVLGSNFAKIPFDLPLFRYDPALEEFHVMSPDPEEEGKFRWTALDEAGITIADVGDMMNLGEIGSVTGSITGTFVNPNKGGAITRNAKRAMTFWRKGPNSVPAAGGFTGGVLGRFAGDAVQYALWYQKTGRLPTADDLKREGWNGVQIEMFATIMGEAGAKILRASSTGIQDAFALSQGKRGVFGEQQRIDVENANLQQTQDDLARVANVLGREDLPVTQGQATHSIDIIEAENFGFANASKKVQRELQKAIARGQRTVQDYIQAVFHGGDPVASRAQILSIGDAITDPARTFTAQTADGVIHIKNKANPDLGVKWEADPGSDYWVNRGTRLRTVDEFGNAEKPDLTGWGMGAELYKTSAKEASTYGKGIASDAKVSEDAINGIWKQIDGDEVIGDLKWADDVIRTQDGNGRWWVETADGSPVVRMAEPPRFTEKLLDDYTTGPARRNAEGKFERNKEFTRFLRSPMRQEKGQVVTEIAQNPWSRQRLHEQILDDYEHFVGGGGQKFNHAEFELWKQEVGPHLGDYFNPEDLISILRPGGLRHVVEANRATTDALTMTMSRQLEMPLDSIKWKDPTVQTIWQQLKKQEHDARIKSMRLLDQFDMGDVVRGRFKEDLKHTLLQKTKAGNATGFNDWYLAKDTKGLIEDILGPVYRRDLDVVSNVLQRRSDRNMVKGVGTDINPTGLALTRVIFGPLSRAQRFFSAARRGQVRGGAAKAADIVTNPDQLSALVRLRAFPVGSRIVARTIQDLGGWELFGEDILGFIPTGASDFRADDPAHRAAVEKYVLFALSQDEGLAAERERVNLVEQFSQ